jgi:hypothetical protein
MSNPKAMRQKEREEYNKRQLDSIKDTFHLYTVRDICEKLEVTLSAVYTYAIKHRLQYKTGRDKVGRRFERELHPLKSGLFNVDERENWLL